ncbi:hypothetical protein OK006_8798 [Actinobacteria bacterium OK006]|nr:hypothetical protein OK006_8798 [Actinobacteria bacterium OK006]
MLIGADGINSAVRAQCLPHLNLAADAAGEFGPGLTERGVCSAPADRAAVWCAAQFSAGMPERAYSVGVRP